jgi:hemoglobin-like flavoprotein
MLTLTQIELVQVTFAAIAPMADDAAALFYRRLFEIDPRLEQMFKGNMANQRRMLMQMLTAAVKGLPRLDRLVPVIEDLGRRHANYGVTDAHYDTVAAALLWTLEKGLGSAFTPEVKEAWTTVYGILASTMKNAAAKQLSVAQARRSDSDALDSAAVPVDREVTVRVERQPFDWRAIAVTHGELCP